MRGTHVGDKESSGLTASGAHPGLCLVTHPLVATPGAFEHLLKPRATVQVKSLAYG